MAYPRARSTRLVSVLLLLGMLLFALNAAPASIVQAQVSSPLFEVSKTFNPGTVAPTGLSTLTITLTNRSAFAIALTQVTDTLPGTTVNGVVIAPAPNPTTTCTGGVITAAPITQTISMAGGVVPAQLGAVPGTCTIQVTVQGRGTPQTYTNSIPLANVVGTIQSTPPELVYPNASASATLSITPLSIDVNKFFTPATVSGGSASVLNILLINSSSAPLTGIAFTDTFPAGMIIATPANFNTGTCGGNLIGVEGGGTFSYNGGTLATGAVCTLTLNVRLNVTGSRTNTLGVGAVTSTNGAANASAAQSTLTNVSGASVSKFFNPTTIAATTGTSLLTITIQNTSAAALTNLGLIDTLPAGLQIAAAPAPVTTCGGPLTAAAGTQLIQLTGGTLAAATTCTITVPVRSTIPGSYTNTIPAGALTNTNLVTNALPSSDSLTVTGVPAITLQKTGVLNSNVVAPAGIANAGDTITYTFTISNTGNEPLHDITLTDPFVVVAGGPLATLAVGAVDSTTFTSTLTLTQAMIDSGAFFNQATVNALSLTNLPVVYIDNFNQPLQAFPAITLTKVGTLDMAASAPAGEANAGDLIHYTLTATNTGNFTLTNVTVTDTRLPALTCTQPPLATLAPNAAQVCTADYTLTQADIDTGQVDNTASADSTQTPLVNTPNTVVIPQITTLGLAKVLSSYDDVDISGSITLNDVLHFTITATNTGNTTQTGVTVSDPLLVPAAITCPSAAPDATCVLAGTHTVTQADVDAGSFVNTAEVASAQITTPVTATVNTAIPRAPALVVLKTVTSAGPYLVGSSITFDIVARNTGNVTLTGVTITDPAAVLGACAPTTLAPGATLACTAAHVVTQANLDAGSFANTATAAGTPPAGPAVTDSDTVNVALPPAPALSLVKAGVLDMDVVAPTGTANVGDVIHYTLTATNTGNITLTGVTITDPRLPALTCTPASGSSLAPTAAMVCTGNFTLTLAAVNDGFVNNTATADSAQTTPISTPNTVNIPQTASLSISKTLAGNADEDGNGMVSVNDTLSFTVIASNTGNYSQTAVSISDPQLTPNTNVCASVAPNAICVLSGTHVVTQAEVASGSFINTASAVSTQAPNPVTATVTTTIPQTPALTVLKSETSTGPYGLGDTISYSIVVTNSGNITLNTVTLVDNAAVLGACAPTQPAVLDPTETMTCLATHQVSQTDLESGSYANTATADSAETPTQSSTATVVVTPNPALTVLKTESSTGPYNVGDPVNFTILVTNTGNITLNNVTVTDGAAVLGTCTPPQPANLAVSATMTCPAIHVVTQDDVDAGTLVNTASAVSDETAPVTSTATVSFASTPDMTLVKAGTLDRTASAPTNAANAGDVVNYTLTATNTGSVTLSGVTIADPLLPGLTCVPTQPAALAPSGTLVCSGAYTLTQADMNAGVVNNTATVTGNPPLGSAVSATASETISLAQTASVGAAKRASTVTLVSPGTYDVTFDFTVENFGNVALSGLQVSDDLAAAFPAPTTFSVRSITSPTLAVNTTFNGRSSANLLTGADALAPGATGVITVVVRVVPAGSGPFNNSATVSAAPPTGPRLTDVSQNGADPDSDNDGDPTDNNDPTPVDFGARLFDPPMGIKTVSDNGLSSLRWNVVWINDSNISGVAASASDPIPNGTTYLAAGAASGYPVPSGAPAGSTNVGVTCRAVAASAGTFTTLCYYEGPTSTYPRGRIVWQGTLGPDLGATSAASANDEMLISFTTTVNTGVTSTQNTAVIDSDLNGDSDTTDAGEQQVATTSADWNLDVDTGDVKQLPSTGFAPNLTTALPAQPAALAYTALDDLTLEIPALGVKTSIVGLPFVNNGWDATWLGSDAGWLGGTAFPSWEGNSVLTGHVYKQSGMPGPFANLSKLKWGDQIIVHAYGETYIYEVRSSVNVKPDDTSVLGHKDKPWLTLLTCKEYSDKTKSYLWRVAVQAVLISTAR